MLVDFDHIVQRKVEIGNYRTGRCLGYLHVEADSNRCILWSRILLRMTSGVWNNVEFCTLAACVQRLACRTISACAEPLITITDTVRDQVMNTLSCWSVEYFSAASASRSCCSLSRVCFSAFNASFTFAISTSNLHMHANHLALITLPLGKVQSIVMSMSVCLSVSCSSVSLLSMHHSPSQAPYQNFTCKTVTRQSLDGLGELKFHVWLDTNTDELLQQLWHARNKNVCLAHFSHFY